MSTALTPKASGKRKAFSPAPSASSSTSRSARKPKKARVVPSAPDPQPATSASQQPLTASARVGPPSSKPVALTPQALAKRAPSVPKGARVRKLAPPRPVNSGLPKGSAVTGPSAQIKGRNTILVSRKSSLGSYMARCRSVIVDEGCPTLTLHAMTTSIPHCLTLLHSLLSILPFPRAQLSYTITTTSVPLTDEIIPADEEEDIALRNRFASGVEIILRVGRGSAPTSAETAAPKKTRRGKKKRGVGKENAGGEASPMDEDEGEMLALNATQEVIKSAEDFDDEEAAMNS